jgi:hypothetical protein
MTFDHTSRSAFETNMDLWSRFIGVGIRLSWLMELKYRRVLLLLVSSSLRLMFRIGKKTELRFLISGYSFAGGTTSIYSFHSSELVG